MSSSSLPDPSSAAIAALAPTGTLRAAINLSNFLLVTGRSPSGDPQGVSPDMALELANRLGVGVEYMKYKTPADLSDDADNGVWDIGNIGAEPKRAEQIAFSAAYCEIEATYLVPAGSQLRTIADVDKAGVRIAYADKSAYGLWLDRNIVNAECIRVPMPQSAFDVFVSENCDALAGLRPGLINDIEKLPGSTMLDGQFTAVQQAMGTPRTRDAAGSEYLNAFVEYAKASGLVASLIERHNVVGLSVAGPA